MKPLWRNNPDIANYLILRKNRQVTKPNKRGHPQATAGKICVVGCHYLIKAYHSLPQLATHATNQQITERPQITQHQRRPGFELPVGLRQAC